MLWFRFTALPKPASPHVDFHFISPRYCSVLAWLSWVKHAASNYTCVVIASYEMKRTRFQILKRGFTKTYFCSYDFEPLTRRLNKCNYAEASKSPHHQRHWFLKGGAHMRGFPRDLNSEDSSVGSIWNQSRPRGQPEPCRRRSRPASISEQHCKTGLYRKKTITVRIGLKCLISSKSICQDEK